MSGDKLKRSSANKRGFALLSISVCQWLTDTACGRPQDSLADLRRYAARWALALRTDDLEYFHFENALVAARADTRAGQP